MLDEPHKARNQYVNPIIALQAARAYDLSRALSSIGSLVGFII